MQKVCSVPIQRGYQMFQNSPHCRGSVPCLDHGMDTRLIWGFGKDGQRKCVPRRCSQSKGGGHGAR